MAISAVLLYITVTCISFTLGYWAWFDRRHYGFGLLASLAWAIGIFVSSGAVLVALILFVRALH